MDIPASGQAERFDGPALIHVGYPKCASTTLQRQVFQKEFLGAELAAGRENFTQIFAMLALENGYLFESGRTDRAMADLEEPLRAAGLMPVWSAESLIGSDTRSQNGPLVLSRIAALQRPVRVLIVIREQRRFTYSCFQQYVRDGGIHPLGDYIGTGREPLGRLSIMRCEHLHFEIAVRRWRDDLGAENVLVLPMEHLVADPDGFVARLAEFAGRPAPATARLQRENKGLGPFAISVQRFMNRILTTSPVKADKPRSYRVMAKAIRILDRLTPAALNRRIERRWRARIEARYAGEFADGNRALERLIGFDLRVYGYQ